MELIERRSRTATRIANEANWFNLQRLCVIAMVVLRCKPVAIGASEFARRTKLTALNRVVHNIDGSVHRGMRESGAWRAPTIFVVIEGPVLGAARRASDALHAASDSQISGRNSCSVKAPPDCSTNRRLSFADGRRFAFPGVRHFNCARYPGLIPQASAKASICSALRSFR